MTLQRLLSSAVLLSAAIATSYAQNITSVRSGTLHKFDGNVAIDGQAVETRPAYFPQIKDAGTLKTGRGRAEVLLTPGVFLRIGEFSSIKMLDSRLTATRVEFLSGSAVLEQIDPLVNTKGNAVSIVFKDYEITLRKDGLVELFGEPASVKVYKGEAEVVALGGASASRVVVKGGRMVTLNAVLAAEKFDEKSGDDLLLWSRDRSMAMSAVNMSSARNANNSGYGNFYGSGYSSNGSDFAGLGFGSGYGSRWYYNPLFGTYTYMPLNGTFYSPWGFGYFSPNTINQYYYPSGGYTWNGGGRSTGSTGVALPSLSTGSANMANTLNRLHSGVSTASAPGHSSPTAPVFGPNLGRGDNSGFGAGSNNAPLSNAGSATIMPSVSAGPMRSGGSSMGGGMAGGGASGTARPSAAK